MGKKDNKYKNLKIVLDDIPGIINSWGLENGYNSICIELPKDMNAQTLNYLVDCNGKVATLAVFPAKGGVCTISPNFGKEKELSAAIADYICAHSGKLADSNPYKNGLSVDMPKDEFEALFDLLKEQEDVVVDEVREETGKKFFARLRNQRYGDSIIISYYYTGKFVIQGKQRELFCSAVELVSERHGLQKIVNAETKSAGLSIDSHDIINDMETSLGKAYNFLGEAHKGILSSAYVFLRTNIVISDNDLKMDYSVLFHPASRVLEGYILKQLVHNNVLHENGEAVGYYFRTENDEDPLTLYPQYVSKIDNDTIVTEINRLYKLFHRVRHPYSHASENDYTTSIITDRALADKYFKEIIEAISSSYDIIAKAKL